MLGKFRFSASAITLFLLFIIIGVVTLLNFPKNVLSWDVFGYYLYLPAKFIYHDLGLHNQQWLNDIITKYHNTETLYQAYSLPNGNWVMKYPLGMAMIFSPFFLIAHLLAPALNFPADGFSFPYQLMIIICGLSFTLLGLIFFRKLLLEYFSEKISTILLIITCLGTNYFSLTALNGVMPHNFMFALLAIMVWSLVKWEKKHKYIHALILGLSAGLIIVTRPNEIVFLLLIILWGVYNKKSITDKIRQFYKYKIQTILILFVIFCVVFPQLYYWKSKTGSWFFYSYDNPGEGFEFLRPYLVKVLFSFRKGWLIYTPIMIFSILGFISLYRSRKPLFYAILFVFLLNLYVVSSWSCWWYAGADFSQRGLMSSYAILAIPLGALIEDIARRKILKYIVAVLFVFLITLNLFQTLQFKKGILTGERNTLKYYLKIFGKLKINEDDKKYLLIERTFGYEEKLLNEKYYNYKVVSYMDFEKYQERNPEIYTDSISHTGKWSLCLYKGNEFSPSSDVSYLGITEREYAWIRASANVFIPNEYQGELPLLVVTFMHNGKNYKYRTKAAVNTEETKGVWQEISIDYMTPEVRSKTDKLAVYIWHRGQEKVYVDDIRVEVFEPYE